MAAAKAVAILGGGAWGTTLACLLAANNERVLLWVRDADVAQEINTQHTNSRYSGQTTLPSPVVATHSLAEVTREADLLLSAIPLVGLRQVARDLGNVITGDRIVVSCAKGIEPETHQLPTQVFREETCVKKLGVLSGPNLAKEILAGQPCATVIASRYREVTQRVIEAIMGPQFRVYASSDLIGVEMAGALKNIIALAAGMCSGLGFGANSLAALITRGLAETTRYAVLCGADHGTMSGLAGIGDLFATCSSELSRNHQVGRRIAAGDSLEQALTQVSGTAEGVRTTAAVVSHAQSLGCELPIAEGVHSVLFDGGDPQALLRALMAREARYEDGARA